LENIIMPL